MKTIKSFCQEEYSTSDCLLSPRKFCEQKWSEASIKPIKRAKKVNYAYFVSIIN